MTRRNLLLIIVLLGMGYIFMTSPNLTEIGAGIAIFLFGMMSLEQGFKTFTGGTLERILQASTNRIWKSLSFGMVSTTLMQSSTLISLVTISFVSAEMITLAAGIGVIMGANIGTTTGAWLIAGLGMSVNIAAYALPAVVFGVVLTLQRSKTLKGLGYLALGIGFLFLGIHYMKEGFDAFQGSFDLSAYAVTGLTGVLLYTGIGVALTVIMQSSHATLLVIIAALASGQVSYENALALAIGANLGSAVTTAIAGMTADLGGKRLALAHVIFNLITAIVAISFIGQIGLLIDYLSAAIGIADNLLLKLALFHTVFNVLGVLLLLPFVHQLAAFLERYVQFAAKPTEQPRYLYSGALETPASAINAVRKELNRLYDNTYDLLAHGLSLERSVIDSDQSLTAAIAATGKIKPLDVDDVYERKIKSLHSAIIAFISATQGRGGLEESSAQQLFELQQSSRDLVEAVKAMKHLHKNLSRYGLATDPVVREPYNRIRRQIALTLREIQEIRSQDPESVTSLSLDGLKLSLEQLSRKFTADLNRLIHDGRLAPNIATSMMNDESYTYELCENLIEAAEALVQPGSAEDEAAESKLALDDEEIARIVETTANPDTLLETRPIR